MRGARFAVHCSGGGNDWCCSDFGPRVLALVDAIGSCRCHTQTLPASDGSRSYRAGAVAISGVLLLAIHLPRQLWVFCKAADSLIGIIDGNSSEGTGSGDPPCLQTAQNTKLVNN